MAEYRPEMPLYVQDEEIWTYQDGVEHLVDLFNMDRDARNLRQAKRSLYRAYRDLPNYHQWAYYHRRKLLESEASQASSTITYDHTGGANERMVTIAAGTWPANAKYGSIIINDVHYQIDDRISDTVITLRSDSNPGADVAALTAYEWYREAYYLPVNFRRMSQLLDASQTTGLYPLQYVSPSEHHRRSRNFWGQTVDRPEWYTLRNDDRWFGAPVIVLGRPPNAGRTYDYIYEVNPRPLHTYAEETGTVSGSTATITGSGTTFTSRHIGSVIRLGTSAALPVSRVGGFGSTVEYAEQRIVTAVASATSLTVDKAPDSSVSGVKFSISDPLDLEVHSMLTVMLKLAEYEMAVMLNRDATDTGKRWNRFMRDLQFAMEADRRNTSIASGAMDDYAGTGRGLIGDVTGVPS